MRGAVLGVLCGLVLPVSGGAAGLQSAPGGGGDAPGTPHPASLVLAPVTPAPDPGLPVLVDLPGGPMQMGSDAPASTAAERPVTGVVLPPFRLSATEITVAQYRRFLAGSGHDPGKGCHVWTAAGRMRFDAAAGWDNPGHAVTDASPVACVSWADASAYAAWLGRETGLPVRLPSEAELEFAIRAGTSGDFPFDDTDTAICEAVNGADAGSRFAWRNRACSDGFAESAPVGSLPANGLGLVDTLGNLWEWAADCWVGNHRGAAADGRARTAPPCTSRALRGGSWDDPPANLRSAYRVGIPATRRQANVGFRVAAGD